MGIILGAEKKIVFLNTHKPSPVDQATVNIIGVFSTKKAITEQLITSIKDVTGVAAGDTADTADGVAAKTLTVPVTITGVQTQPSATAIP